MSVIFVVLAGCLVGSKINRGARKLARTSRVIKKKKKTEESEIIKFDIELYIKLKIGTIA
jgi:hypothetical protein